MNPYTVWDFSVATGKLKIFSDYVNIKKVSGKGRGMCAKRAIRGGTVFIREYSILSCPDTPESIFAAYKRLKRGTPRDFGAVHCLKHDTTMTGYQRFRSVMCNAVKNDSVYYLYMSGGFLNHSCYPNAYATSYMGVLNVVTLGNINEGDEISISYTTVGTLPIDLRELAFAKKYSWKCMCELCGGRSLKGWTTEERSVDIDFFCDTCETGRTHFLELTNCYAETYSKSPMNIERVIRDFHILMTAAGASMGYIVEPGMGLDLSQHADLDLDSVNMNPLVYTGVCRFIDYLSTYDFQCEYTGRVAIAAVLSMLDYAILVAEIRCEQFSNAYIGHVLMKCVLLRIP